MDDTQTSRLDCEVISEPESARDELMLYLGCIVDDTGRSQAPNTR